MKPTLIILLFFVFQNINGQARPQEKTDIYKFDDLYLQAIKLYLNKFPHADTLIIQKEDYLPKVLPENINNHVILYLTKEEIECYYGNDICMGVITPIKKEKDLYVVHISFHGYTKRWKYWVLSGGVYYKFKLDKQKKEFIFIAEKEWGV